MSAASSLVPEVSGYRRPGLLKRVFSFPAMIGGLLLVLAVFTVRSRFDDPDMWWHLKMGEIVWTTHTIPTTDIFSYTTHHHAWTPHEWLSQVLIYLPYRWLGLTGLMLWLCGATTAIFLAGYALCCLYSGNLKVSFLGAMVIFLFATVGLSVRPQMLGYLLLIFELIAIHLGRTRNARWFWLLPPLFALWVNCHGSFFLGILVVCAFLFSSFFEFHLGSLSAQRWTAAQRRTLLLVLLVSVAALFLNPGGLKQVLYPLDTLLHQPLGLSAVDEWQPLVLTSERGVYFLAALAAILLLAILQRAELHLDEMILLVAGAWLAAGHLRMVFVFGILAAPVLSRMLASSWENYTPETDKPWLNAGFVAFALTIAFLGFPDRKELASQAEEKSPVKAVEFLQSHHLSGPMLNEYGYGGYLIWAAPEHPVFVDGRADVFEWTGVLEEFGNWATLQTDPRLLLDKYGIQFILLTPTSPMAHVLPLMPNWKPVYSDSNSVIFVRLPSMAPAH